LEAILEPNRVLARRFHPEYGYAKYVGASSAAMMWESQKPEGKGRKLRRKAIDEILDGESRYR
tara:strand:- start:2826 stop:3014 length:189 start_codon:yes stop_codon:yes gene_type:complete